MASHARMVKYPTGFTYIDILSYGTTGIIFSDQSSNTVVKAPHSELEQALVDAEKRIYERFTERGGHAGLLRYLGTYENGIRLERVKPMGILAYIREHGQEIDTEQRLRWCADIAATLAFIHASGVIHGDFKCGNVLLDGALHAKVADFGGSSLDGSELGIMVTASHRMYGDLKSREGDVFALGSTLYEIMTGSAPFADCTEEDIESRYSRSEFADTSKLGPVGEVIRECWLGELQAADVTTRISALSMRTIDPLEG